jgi:hypothetical protein
MHKRHEAAARPKLRVLAGPGKRDALLLTLAKRFGSLPLTRRAARVDLSRKRER